jgi:hypothetical protein
MQVKGHENARLPVPLCLVIFPGVQTNPASSVVAVPSPLSAASDDGVSPAALEARLDEFPLDVLLGLVASSHRSGVLEIDGPRPVMLYFADGDLCGGESLEDTTLRAAVGAASPAVRRDRARAVVEDHLVTALAATLIPSPEANARFRPGPADPELSRYRFRIPAMLVAAHERVEAWRVIADVIPSTETVLQLASDLPDTLDQVLIERADWQILSCVNGARDVADIVGRSGRSAFDVCSALYRMIVLGVIAIP